MHSKILVGYDDTDESKDALALGKQLAEATGAELVAAGVSQFDPVWGGALAREPASAPAATSTFRRWSSASAGSPRRSSALLPNAATTRL